MSSLQMQLDIALFGAPDDVLAASGGFLRCQVDASLSEPGEPPRLVSVDTLPYLTPALSSMGGVVRVGELRVSRLPPASGERLFEADLTSWSYRFPGVAFVLMARKLCALPPQANVCFMEVSLPAALNVPVSQCLSAITASSWKKIAPSWLIDWREACQHEDSRDHAFESLVARLPCLQALEAFTRQRHLERCWSSDSMQYELRERF